MGTDMIITHTSGWCGSKVESCQTVCFKELDHESELKEWGRRVDAYSEDVLFPLNIR